MVRQHRWVLVAVMALLLPGSWAWADYEAVATARYDLRLGFTVPGKVEKIHVEPGDVVKAGDVLIELENVEPQALMELWKLRAQSDTQLRTAQQRLRLAELQERKLRELMAEHAAREFEYEQAKIQLEVERLRVKQAEEETAEAQLQYGQAKANYERYIRRAPRDGVVDRIAVSEGELVEESKPVLRLVAIDPLWLDVWVPTYETFSLEVGAPAWVHTRIKDDHQPITGKIIHMAQVADSSSETRLVRVEMPNERGLPAGLHVDVTFEKPSELAAVNPKPEGQ